jgi:hypothetical protein
MKGMEYDILLGIDYFNKTGLGIVPKTRKLLFPYEEINIPKHDMESSCYLLVDGDDLSAEQFVDIKFNKEYIVVRTSRGSER